MTKIEIKSIFGNILFTYEAENATIKDAVEKAVKEKVSLSYSNLSYSNLSYSNLSYSNLRGSDLSNSNLRGSNLSNSDLSNSNLRGSDLSNSNLSNLENKETACLPLFCKWNFSILGDKIQIGCEKRTIENWDLFFASDEKLSTERNTQDFKQIQAVYNACKAYLLTLNQ